MPKFQFPSDNNAALFQDVLDAADIPHEREGGTVSVEDALPPYMDGQVEALGGWDVAPDNSTTGVNGFTDISAFSIRSNPPAVARGYVPLEARPIQTPAQDRGRSDFASPDRLVGSFPQRRSTRGQPL